MKYYSEQGSEEHMSPLVTILIPNYKTLNLTKHCLSLVYKNTDLNKARVIVIDNDSQDDSLEYLRTVSWIQLIERKAIPHEGAISSHSRALDLGLAEVTTPYVLSIHTDTLVKHPKWLEFLIAQFEQDSQIAGVGSWKLESKAWWRRLLKNIERYAQLIYFRLLNKTPKTMEGIGKNYYYLRSHCAMYRMDIIKQLNLRFTGDDMVAGKEMHKHLVEAGYSMLFLSSEVLIKYVEHINHATTVLNPELSTRLKSVNKGLLRIQKSLMKINLRT